MTIIDVRYQLNKILGYDKMYSNNFKEYEKLLKVLEDAGDSRYLFYKARFLQKSPCAFAGFICSSCLNKILQAIY